MAENEDVQHRLFEAAECSDPAGIGRAIGAGADPDASNESGETALTIAIQRGVGHPETVRALLAHGADPNRIAADGWSPWLLNQAMRGDRFMASAQNQIAELLAARGASDPRGDLVGLEAAASRGDTGEVERLLAQGLDPGSAPVGLDALHAAAAAGHEDVVARLIDAGMPLDRCEPGHFTPLIRAAYDGHLNVVRLLVAAGADVAAEVEGMGNAADYAAMGGHSHVVEWLESHGSARERRVTAVLRPSESSRDAPGWRLFSKHAGEIGNGEHSLLFVEGPIDEVSRALSGLLESAELLQGIHERPQAVHRRAHDIYLVQLVDNPWTLVVHGIGSLGRGIWDEGRSLSKQISATHGWRVVYASENDTDCESWFTCYEAGERRESTRDAGCVRKLGILLPGFNPYHDDGLEVIGVAPHALLRVDVVSCRFD